MSNLIVGKIIILILLIFTIFLLMGINEERSKAYDCGMAEWHPDIPARVKEECRQLRREEIRKNQENGQTNLYRT
jgi:hypothetical protein